MITVFVYPMLVLVLLTFAVLFVMGFGRVKFIASGGVHIKKFRLMEGKADLPEWLQRLDRNLSNLLEIPVLFYLWCLVMMVLQPAEAIWLNLAWAYVALRCLHTCIHVSYNNVNHRFLVYVVSCLLLLGMWLGLLTLL